LNIEELNYYYNKFKFGEDNFHNLMRHKVREVLLVSTFYDAYIFEQEARITQEIAGEYHQLNLTQVPRITSVPTGEEALKIFKEGSFDLVITTMRIGDLSPFEFAKKIKAINKDIPILLLLTVKNDIATILNNEKKSAFFDNVFLWNGDSKLFLAMIKYVEDTKNIEYDTENGLVRVILLVEDSVNFYSSYLPLLYTEVMTQTQRLISEELNDNQKYFRMRARPKVILVKNYEDAYKNAIKYRDFLLCVISDISYQKDGKTDEFAGIKLIGDLRKQKIDVPFLLQSSDDKFKDQATDLRSDFIHKHSPTLLADLRSFVLNNLGFGDFIFRDGNGTEIGRSHSIADLEERLKQIPIDSFLYHSRNNHFSIWLIARGEIQVARKLRPVKDSDFPDTETHRQFLIDVFHGVRENRNRGKIIDFDPYHLRSEFQIVRLAGGSLGGKGRGIAFLNALLSVLEFDKTIPDVDIKIPLTAIIGTDEFDSFVNKLSFDNKLLSSHMDKDDEWIKKKFLSCELSDDLNEKLFQFLEVTSKPLAVRSSGLLEDSQSQPFAGVYQTYMIPNNQPDISVRIKQLSDAIKLVFCSVFLSEARGYIEGLDFRIEEEKMAVVIQEIAGQEYDGYYYPHFSGVAQSYNYYPISYMNHSDGVANLAVGLGQSVVEGGRNFRYCPKYPQLNYLTVEDLVKSSQTEFFALDLNNTKVDMTKGEDATLSKLNITECEKHGNLYQTASVWDSYNQRIEDGLSMPGPRVINFANIVKYESFPLSSILNAVLDVSEKAFGVPVEIEFAADLTKNNKPKENPKFYMLQVRPLTINIEECDIDPETINKNELILYTENGMGNGVICNIYDIVYLDPNRFDKTMTVEMQKEIEKINKLFKESDREYILIGPGRWGTRDRFLGIPVQWGQINKTKVIVETGLEDFDIEPSQGTHFFHNLIAMNAGYFHIKHRSETDFIDWEWIRSQKVAFQGDYFTHIRSEVPYRVIMDGLKGISVVCKHDHL